jgi:hypothetical protein
MSSPMIFHIQREHEDHIWQASSVPDTGR